MKLIQGHRASYSPKFYNVDEAGYIFYDAEGHRHYIDTIKEAEILPPCLNGFSDKRGNRFSVGGMQ